MARVGVCTRPTVVKWESARLGIKSGHGPRAVDPDQPIRFRPADGGIGQWAHRGVLAQGCESLPDGAVRHGLQPEPLDGCLALAYWMM